MSLKHEKIVRLQKQQKEIRGCPAINLQQKFLERRLVSKRFSKDKASKMARIRRNQEVAKELASQRKKVKTEQKKIIGKLGKKQKKAKKLFFNGREVK